MGIPGFFNYLKNKLDSSKYKGCIKSDDNTKYDIMILDYQSLFYNIYGLYAEFNYLIRLLFAIKFNRIKKYDNNLIKYIVKKFPNLMKKLGNIDNIIDNLPISDKDIEDVIIEDMIEHTINLSKKYVNGENNNVYIYFDSIPSIAKIKEQLSRRMSATVNKYIENDIINNSNDNYEREIRKKMITNFPGVNLDTTLINTTKEKLIRLGFIVNDVKRYGEAEHMIMTDIMKGEFKNKKCLLASSYADLILLLLIASEKYNSNINIYRESIVNENVFDFSYKYIFNGNTIISPYKRNVDIINIDMIKKFLNLNTKQKVLDICYLFLLLGDDFVPILPTINIKIIPDIIKTYENFQSSDFSIVEKLIRLIIRILLLLLIC
jgi:hypothetical protein